MIEYPYDQLPAVIEFAADPDISTFTLTISDDTGSGCSNSIEFDNPCEDYCSIFSLSATVGDCDGDDQFELVIDFDHQNTSEVFDIHITYDNGIVIEDVPLSSFPYTVTGLTEECTSDILIAVYDTEDNGCAQSIFISPVCCSYDLCDLDDLVIDVSECDGTEFTATFDFEYVGTSDFFTYTLYNAQGVEVQAGTSAYNDLPLQLFIDNTDSDSYQIVIRDQEDQTCFINDWFDNPCFLECLLSNLTATVLDCANGAFSLVVDFDYENANEYFDLHITYPFGLVIENVAYADLPYTVTGLAEDCNSVIEVLVCDAENGNCLDFIDIGPVCCADICMIGNMNMEVSECDGSEFAVFLDFDYSGNVLDFDYTLYDDVSTVVEQGVYTYADLPLEINLDNTTSIVYYVVIEDQEDPLCVLDGYFDNPCYEQTGDCFIGDLLVTQSDCTEDAFFSVEINFEYANTSDQFTVNGNGNSYGSFSYADLPITLDLEGDCETDFEFVMHDVNNNDCTNFAGLGIVCCEEEECNIISIDYGNNPACVEGLIVTEWFIFGENTSEVGYDIFINNEFLIFVEYNEEGPYDFDIPDPETEFFTIKACDNDNEDCCYTWELSNPCYEEDPECSITELTAEVISCSDDLFDIVVDFEYTNTSNQFIINGNGNSYGTFSYSDLPITLTGLDADCDTDYEFVIQDVNNNDCTQSTGLGPVCCEDFNMIENVSLTTIIDGESFMITFNISLNLLDECEVDLYVNEELVSTIAEDEEQVTIGPFDCGTDEVLFISLVNSCTDEVMNFEVDLGEVACTTGTQIEKIDAEVQWDNFSNTLNIEAHDDSNIDIQVISASGQLIMKDQMLNSIWNKTFDSIPAGVYFVRLISDDGKKGSVIKIVAF